jgi:gamma-glutamyl hydrolase
VRYNLQNGEGIVYFNHGYAVHTSYFRSSSYLKNFWSLTSISTSRSSEEFVSTLEAKQYPFYAVQYHPEKNLFEWKVKAVRSDSGAEIVQILSNRFVDVARQNKNRFSSYEEFKKLAIYNYEAHATTMSFTLIYTFAENVVTQVQDDSQEKHLSLE